MGPFISHVRKLEGRKVKTKARSLYGKRGAICVYIHVTHAPAVSIKLRCLSQNKLIGGVLVSLHLSPKEVEGDKDTDSNVCVQDPTDGGM